MHVCEGVGWKVSAYHFTYGQEDEPHRHKYIVGPALPQVNHVIKTPSKAEAQGLSLKFLTGYSLRERDTVPQIYIYKSQSCCPDHREERLLGTQILSFKNEKHLKEHK